MWAAIGRWTGRQWLGGGLLAIGLGATISLAYVAGAANPPSQAVQVGLAALTILANAGASFAYSGVGRADPSHAQQSVARLLRLGAQAADARKSTEAMFSGSAGKAELHTAMGMLSRDWSYIEDGLVEAIGDWRVFHPFAVEQARINLLNPSPNSNPNNGQGSGGP